MNKRRGAREKKARQKEASRRKGTKEWTRNKGTNELESKERSKWWSTRWNEQIWKSQRKKIRKEEIDKTTINNIMLVETRVFSYRMLCRGFALCTWTSQIGQNLLVSRCRTMQLRQTATEDAVSTGEIYTFGLPYAVNWKERIRETLGVKKRNQTGNRRSAVLSRRTRTVSTDCGSALF
jgi:hypothetical protein